MRKIFTIIVICLALSFAYADEGKVLFDNAHAQMAGNADWVINGGYSDFADTLKQQGYVVEENTQTLQASILQKYNVLVIPEPNRRFAASEITAITDFIQNGGGVLFIADHDGSDRDNDGYDSVKIYNEFVAEFGFTFDKRFFSEHPIAGQKIEHDATYNVFKVGCWGATSMTVLDPTKAKALLCVSQQYGGNPFILAAEYGQGRIIGIGDSSPFDDGTGNPSNSLHDNYNMSAYDHHEMARSFVRWLSRNPLPRTEPCYGFSEEDDQ